jgi:hypothetical protein
MFGNNRCLYTAVQLIISLQRLVLDCSEDRRQHNSSQLQSDKQIKCKAKRTEHEATLTR